MAAKKKGKAAPKAKAKAPAKAPAKALAKVAAAKAPAKKAPGKLSASSKKRTKSEIFNAIAEFTELPRSKVAAVVDALANMIQLDLSKKGPQVFAMPGLCKFVTKVKPASPERQGRNPFTGEEITIKAKPASRVVRIRPLKTLKDAVM